VNGYPEGKPSRAAILADLARKLDEQAARPKPGPVDVD
jgi:hypothetical protein